MNVFLRFSGEWPPGLTGYTLDANFNDLIRTPNEQAYLVSIVAPLRLS